MDHHKLCVAVVCWKITHFMLRVSDSDSAVIGSTKNEVSDMQDRLLRAQRDSLNRRYWETWRY